MLRNTRYFYTWDTHSQTNVEALYCGAIPVGLRWTPPFAAAIFDPAHGPYVFTPWTMENGVITVAYEPEQFNERRRRYLDYFRAAALAVPQTISKLAADIEHYFEEASCSAGVTDAPAALAAEGRQ
jgi:hypothetical protein